MDPHNVVACLRALDNVMKKFLKTPPIDLSPFDGLLDEATKMAFSTGNGTRAVTPDEAQALVLARALQLWVECVREISAGKDVDQLVALVAELMDIRKEGKSSSAGTHYTNIKNLRKWHTHSVGQRYSSGSKI